MLVWYCHTTEQPRVIDYVRLRYLNFNLFLFSSHETNTAINRIQKMFYNLEPRHVTVKSKSRDRVA